MAKIKGIFIYSDHPSKSLSIPEIINYLKFYGFSVQYRGDLFEFLALPKEEALELARRIAVTRVLDIESPIDEIREPIYGEIDVELRRLKGEGSYLEVGAIGFAEMPDHHLHYGYADSALPTTRTIHELPLLYDGLWLQRIFYKIMASKNPSDFNGSFIQIIFTSRLFVTFETGGSLTTLPLDPQPDRGYPRSQRYHARVVLTGLPSLISTSGIVEAPARPKEYYWLKASFIHAGKDLSELDLIYKGRFIEYEDPRISSVLAPYVLQAIFYELTGNPFCDNPSCCLYNSHWQEEVLKAQIEGKLCEEHRDVILGLNSK